MSNETIGSSYAADMAPDQVLTIGEVVKILKDHGHGRQAFASICDEFGVFPGEGYGSGEVFTYGAVMEWLGY